MPAYEYTSKFGFGTMPNYVGKELKPYEHVS